MKAVLKVAVGAAITFAIYGGLWLCAQFDISRDFGNYADIPPEYVPTSDEDCRLMADAFIRAEHMLTLPGLGCRKVKSQGIIVYGSLAAQDMNRVQIPHYTGDTIVSPAVEVPKYSENKTRAVVNYRRGGGTGEDGYGMGCEYRKVLGLWWGLGCHHTWVS
jgi:hypothetical protein